MSALLRWCSLHKNKNNNNNETEIDICAICQGPKTDPVKLRCVHTFCKLCMNQYRRYCVELTCPLCRCRVHSRYSPISWCKMSFWLFVLCAIGLVLGYVLMRETTAEQQPLDLEELL
ncbi:maker43 [Drosophila busckii]|uniref:Maker43 n=1 Tax=Drosophila busckii TaxID=30019 RepID=A0A0M4EDP0_DROBS|nr:tripartite motif-containing protein 43C [Drosophila busckii]ALC41126.1 maker43 [Drosophila busckii]